VRTHAHRIQQLTAQELEAHDAAVRVVAQVLLQEEQVVWQPDRGIAREDCLDFGQRLHDVNSSTAAALIRFEQGRPCERLRKRSQRAKIVEGDGSRAINAERSQQRGLRALAQFDGERVGPIEDPGAKRLERAHRGERQRNRPRISPPARAGTGLIEAQGRGRSKLSNAALETSNAWKEIPRCATAANSGFCHPGCS
jgi:hypothetical protein